MEVINKLDISNNIIITDECGFLFVDKPVVLENLPSIIPSLINDKYLKIETYETILGYFTNLLNTEWSSIRITVLNGLYLEQRVF